MGPGTGFVLSRSQGLADVGLERVAKSASSNLDHPDVLDTGKRGCSLRISAPAATVGDAPENPTFANIGFFSLPRFERWAQNMMIRSGSLREVTVSIETRIISSAAWRVSMTKTRPVFALVASTARSLGGVLLRLLVLSVLSLQRYLMGYLMEASFPVREIGTVMTLLHACHVL